MQILALGCMSHFLPILPPAHQDHLPPSSLLLWTRAMRVYAVSELLSGHSGQVKGLEEGVPEHPH